MLFLRDIDADVQLRCLACGHGGVLPRAILERRFGPNYPVLSIAPHYRCSRCDSRDIESRPILAVPQDTVPAPTNDEPSFDAPLAALNGLLASLRGDSGPDGRTTDTAPPAPPPPAPVRGKPVSELPLSDLVADGPGDDAAEPLWEPVSLADMAARLGRTSPPDEWDDEPPAKEAKAPANDERPEPARVDASEDGDSEDGDDETLMAMRQLLAQAYGSDDELDGDQEDERYGVAPKPFAGRVASPGDRHASIDDFAIDDFADKSDPGHGEDEPPAFTHKVLVRRDFEDDWSDGDADTDAGTDHWRADSGDDDPEDGFDDREPDGPDNGEPSEDEILSFAIRDPEKPARTSRPAKPEPLPAAEPLDFDQHRAERRAQRPPPPPEDEEGFDRTLAALRSMIEDAANEPAEEDAPSPPHKTARSMGHTGGQTANRSAAKSVDKTAREEEDDPAPGRDEDEWSLPAGWDDSDPAPEPAAPEPEPAGRRSAQEREIEEAMKALRGLIEDEAQPDPRASQPPPPQPKPRAGKPRPARGGPAAPDTPPPAAQSEEAKPGSEPTPLSKTIAALRGMLELDGRRKR
jgi:hypothetical protein